MAGRDEQPPAHDPTCQLCPGNARISGVCNPEYHGVYVFDNDHPCVGPDAPRDTTQPPDPRGVYRSAPAAGVARVICYDPRHHVTLAEMSVEQVAAVIRAWQAQFRELGERSGVNHVLIFENKGKAVGVSNPHPHGQIYGTGFVFKTIENEARTCARHYRETGRALLADILEAELADGRRVVCANDGAVVFVPYFARYAYELFVAPRRVVPDVAALDEAEVLAMARALREALIRLDNLWRTAMPYVMALHQAPSDGREHRGFGFHVELYPPLRKPGLRKHLAGPEIGGGSFLSDTWPEDKAAELRSVADTHYTLDHDRLSHDSGPKKAE